MTEPSGQSDLAEPPRSPRSDPGQILSKHESMLHSLCDQQTYTSQRLDQLSGVLEAINQKLSPQVQLPSAGAPEGPPATPTPPPRFRDAVSPTLENFSGEIGKSGGFLLQCSLVFCRSPHSFVDDASKISYII